MGAEHSLEKSERKLERKPERKPEKKPEIIPQKNVQESDILFFSRSHISDAWQKVVETKVKQPVKLCELDRYRKPIEKIKGIASCGYFLFEGFDSSSRVDIGELLVCYMRELKPYVNKLVVLVPWITNSDFAILRDTLLKNKLQDIYIIDPYVQWTDVL